ncbi:MAG: metallophosphoesterase [Cytophagales bacterium]|nr:MAG: metallophosphoesterase [Cytophagales bacterium]
MNKYTIITLSLLLLIALDYYCYGAIKSAFQDSNSKAQKIVTFIYGLLSVYSIGVLLSIVLLSTEKINPTARNFIISGLFTNFILKIILSLFLLIEDVSRLVRWVFAKIINATTNNTAQLPESIERSEFLSQTALVITALPAIAIGYGIISGAHDYKIRKKIISLPHLPKAFDGLKIVQISDIHSGSFFNKTAVKGGIETIMKQKADVIFFTGDLVNNEAKEMNDWVNVFEKIKAPLGVYSTLGNHDYGDYQKWDSVAEKKQNLQDLMRIHGNMGWNLLMNEHRMLQQNGEQIAILGIENWGKGERWPKYGKLDKAHYRTEEASVKLLLSHDPSHWDAQVRTQYPDIDLTFAGHTHGFQFGIEVGDFRWSPVQYVYKQWAGLYQEQNQRLYVNRGFGYLGFPGRIGMPPEITVIELKKGS